MREKNILTVCVAIPSYNRERVLVDTIEQVLAQDPPADEVFIIDQTEKHEAETEQHLLHLHEQGRIRWIKQQPPNLNKARQRAVQETSCHVLVFIDDDVDLVPSFFEKHARNYVDESVAAVAGRTIQARGNVPADKATPWVRALKFEPFALDGTERIEGVACFIGANHSVRVSSIRQIGGYDTKYRGPLYNESDAALQLVKAGGKIVFDPEAEVYHKQSVEGGVRKSGTRCQPEYWKSFSSIYFHMKHFYPRWYFWKQLLFVQFRRRVLYKENVYHPWRIPWAVISYGYSFLLAAWCCFRWPKTTTENHS